MTNISKVFIVAAHPDDEVLGVGGTVAKHVQDGDECYAVILGEGMTSRFINRESADLEKVETLHQQTSEAARIIGFNEIFFEKLPDNRFDSLDLLDIVKVVEKYVDQIKPDIIYTHFYNDLNIDHRITYQAVVTATRPTETNPVKEVYCFETVSSTEWNFGKEWGFKPNYFIDVSSTINIKLHAISLYQSELRDFPHPRSLENLEATAKKWGSITGVKFAEAFEVVRIIK